MDSEVLALIVRARDEASGAIHNVEKTLGTLADKADLTGRAMSGLHSILSGIGAGIGISLFLDLQNVFARITQLLPDLIGKGIAFGDAVHDLSEKTGASSESASRLLGTFTFLGISTDGLTMKLGVFSKYVVAHEAEMNRLGIATRDANGTQLDGIAIMDQARAFLAQYTNGVQKTAEAAKLFGRAGADMIEYLSLTDAQVASLNAEMDKLGITMDAQGVLKAKQTSQEFNLLGLSVQGVANRLLNDIAPALMSGVQAIADWVASNSKAIASFMANVVNFVLGLISALTGAQFSAVSFAGSLGDLSTASSNLSKNLDTTADSTKAQTKAIDAQIKVIDQQLASIKALDAAQSKLYANATAALDKELQQQYDLLSAEDKRRRSAEDQARLQYAIADAAAKLADAQKGNDPAAIMAAQKALNDATQRMADFQFTAAQDKRKAELDAIKANLKAIDDEVKNSTDKRATLADLHRQATEMASKEAKDKQAGDLQAVADDDLQLQALRTAIARTAQQTRNADSETALKAEKTRLSDLKASIGSAFDPAPVHTFGGAVTAMSVAAANDMRHFSGEIGGGLIGSFAAAKKAGEDFGKTLKDTLAGVSDAITTLIGLVGQLGKALGDQGLSMAGGAAAGAKFGPEGALIGGMVGGAAAAKPGTMMLDPGGPLAGLLNLYDSIFGTHYGSLGHRASGGWAGLNGPELNVLGEKGPEYVIPNHELGRPSGPTVIENRIILDGQEMRRWISQAIASEERSYAGPAYAGSAF